MKQPEPKVEEPKVEEPKVEEPKVEDNHTRPTGPVQALTPAKRIKYKEGDLVVLHAIKENGKLYQVNTIYEGKRKEHFLTVGNLKIYGQEG